MAFTGVWLHHNSVADTGESTLGTYAYYLIQNFYLLLVARPVLSDVQLGSSQLNINFHWKPKLSDEYHQPTTVCIKFRPCQNAWDNKVVI